LKFFNAFSLFELSSFGSQLGAFREKLRLLYLS
jgi:hypothetical protein